jgi:hypothetical protein
MQFDTLRAFPYPVLRPDVDDYTDGDLQATIDFQPSGATIEAEVTFALSVPSILKLIKTGKAKYVVVFACRDTYLRKSVTSGKPKFSASFKTGELRGQVVIYPYIVATSKIKNYKSKLINQEFGKGPFQYEKNELIAVDRPQEVYIDRDLFKPITSVFEMIESQNLQGSEWQIKLDSPKVQILASSELKEKIDIARGGTKGKAILINSIYFSAVMQCITVLKYEPDEYADYKWAQVFKQKCEDMHINISAHPECVTAQRLLKAPFAKVVEYVFSGASND